MSEGKDDDVLKHILNTQMLILQRHDLLVQTVAKMAQVLTRGNAGKLSEMDRVFQAHQAQESDILKAAFSTVKKGRGIIVH